MYKSAKIFKPTDMAGACVFLMQYYDRSEIVNIGTGEDITTRELAEMVALTVGYKGEIVWDHAMVRQGEAV